MAANKQDLLSKLVKPWSHVASFIVLLLGCLVLIGWALNIPQLKSVLPGLATMKANTALCFVLTGVALRAAQDEQANQRTRRLAQICALTVALIGILSLSEWVFGGDFGIDQLLFRDTATTSNISVPGRMAHASAFSFVMLGTALWLLQKPRWERITQLIALGVIGIALLALMGYLYGVTSLYSVFAYSSVSLHTALGLVIASAGILLTHSQHGLMAVTTADSPGGVVARRLLPAVVLVPTIVGWLCLKGQQQGLYSTEFGLALFALSNIFTFALLVWWNARLINREDIQRKQAEASLKRYAQRMEILHEIDNGIINASSIQEVVQTALKHIRQLIPCQRVSVGLFDYDHHEWYLFVVDSNDNTVGEGSPFPIEPGSIENFSQKQIEIVDDLRSLSDPRPAYRQFIEDGLVSALHAHFFLEQQPLGALNLFASTPGFFTAEYQEIAIEIANQLAIAIHQMHLDEALTRQTAELEQRVNERTAELRATIERVEAILNNNTDGILLLHTDLKIQQTNSSFNSLFGCEWDDYFGISLVTLIFAEDADKVTRLVQTVVAEARGKHIEIRALRKDGKVFDAELSIGHIKDDGLVCTIRDITERKAREHQLRYHASLQENVNDAIIVTDMEFRIQSWNKASERIYGWSAEEVIDRATDEVLHTEYPSATDRAGAIKQFREQGWWKGEVIQHHKDGTIIHIFGSVTLVKDKNGLPFSVVSVNHDITQRKITEETLQNKMREERQFQSYLKALHEIIIELTTIDELDVFYKRVVELGRERLGFERLALFLYNERDGNAIGTFGTDTQGNLTDERGVQFTPDPNGIMRRSFDRAERFYFNEQTTLYTAEVPFGQGWNAAAVLWNGTRSLGWFVADNLISHAPASKSHLDIMGLYALSVGTLLAKKQTQLELKESETLYRLLAENISDLIVRSTLTGECLYISPSVQTILGYTPEELIGQQIFDLVHPDDQTIIWDTYASALERNDLIMPHQYRAKQKDGHYVWLETVGKPVFGEKSGEVQEVITSSRDITDRKQAEDALRESEVKFRLFIESAPMATLISDKLGNIILLNHQVEKLFGYARNELLGKSIDELVPELLRTAHIDHRSQYLSGAIERRTHGIEAPARHKDGRVFPAEVQLSYVDLSDNPLVISSVIDVTVRKQAEDTLRQALAKEKELGDLKTRFVSMASHEFRTPLATILALTETLMAYRHKLPDEQIEQRLVKIQDQIGHLKDIMEDVLLLARMQARRVDFHPTRLNLDGLCRSVIDEFQSRSDVTHKIVYSCDERLHEVTLDKKLMRQIINNLVSNAVKYSPPDKPITISLINASDRLIFKVQDEGIGIPEADLKHLFEPFHRAENVVAISGTGLGMVITKESVELHGGTIAVDSQLGIGTTFTVSIPLNEARGNES